MGNYEMDDYGVDENSPVAKTLNYIANTIDCREYKLASIKKAVTEMARQNRLLIGHYEKYKDTMDYVLEAQDNGTRKRGG